MEATLKKRQTEILEAALNLLARGGSHALTTRNLARTLEVTEPALYRHFESKKDLLKALYAFVWQKMRGKLLPVVEARMDFPEKLETFLHAFFDYLAENRGVNLVLLSEAIHHNDPELKEAMLDLLEKVYGSIEAILEEARDKRTIKGNLNLRVAARMVLGFIQATVTRALISGESLDPRTVDTFLHIFWEGAKA